MMVGENSAFYWDRQQFGTEQMCYWFSFLVFFAWERSEKIKNKVKITINHQSLLADNRGWVCWSQQQSFSSLHESRWKGRRCPGGGGQLAVSGLIDLSLQSIGADLFCAASWVPPLLHPLSCPSVFSWFVLLTRTVAHRGRKGDDMRIDLRLGWIIIYFPFFLIMLKL